ncbi:MAG: phospholipid carrier-dependent glycosyltransferase, partial [Pseudomonadota bacterium]
MKGEDDRAMTSEASEESAPPAGRGALGDIAARLAASGWREWAALAGLALVMAGAWAYAFTGDVHFDEHQYLLGAYFWPDLAIYRDYFHSQTPYHPMTLSWWFGLVAGGEPSYIAARAYNAVWTIAVCGLAYGFARRLSGAPLLSAVVALAVVCSPSTGDFLRIVRNDAPALAFAFAAFWLLLAMLDAPARRQSYFALAIGVCLACAVGFKQSYGYVAVTVWAASFFAPVTGGLRQRALRIAGPMAVGGCVGAAPMLAVAAPAFDSFFYETFTFHRTAHAASYNRLFDGCCISPAYHDSFLERVRAG